jgi:hypothetical protein
MPSSRHPTSWSPSIEAKGAALAALALCFLAVAARGEDAPACSQFKWPLATEKSWFAAAAPAELPSGAAISELKEGSFTVALKPSGEVRFALPPETKPKPDKPMGAILAFSTVATSASIR